MNTLQKIDALVTRLTGLAGSDRLFNPYAAQGGSAAAVRRSNLTRYLADMAARMPRHLFLFEAPGYRGCALTGIPVTSERILLAGIPEWGLFGAGYQGTSGQPDGVAEMTATILWDTLRAHLDAPPLIWNTVPLHPHRPGAPASNRTPGVQEQREGAFFIGAIMELFEFEYIFGVGRIAQRALAAQGYPYIPLRHPSQGGKAEFVSGLRAALQGCV